MTSFTRKQVKDIGNALSVDWKKIHVEELNIALNIELKNGSNNPFTLAKIALVRISEIKDYYSWLESRKQ